jgi:hypothetical protein
MVETSRWHDMDVTMLEQRDRWILKIYLWLFYCMSLTNLWLCTETWRHKAKDNSSKILAKPWTKIFTNSRTIHSINTHSARDDIMKNVDGSYYRKLWDSVKKYRTFLFSTASRPPIGPTHPLIFLVPVVKLSGVKLIIYFHLVPMSRMVVLYLHSSIRHHGAVLN